jgi:hypothetical protein
LKQEKSCGLKISGFFSYVFNLYLKNENEENREFDLDLNLDYPIDKSKRFYFLFKQKV